MPDAAVILTLAQARSAWRDRQYLVPGGSRPRPASLAGLVGAVGWVPVVLGDPGVYLALQARGAISCRAELDEATYLRQELSVVPGPRGGTWLVPVADASLARAFAVADHASREARVAAGSAITAQDLRAARDALRAGLEQPVTPEALRAGLPASVNRGLGEVGRRAGSPTLAALVLRGMWIHGEVLRVPIEARVDSVRCRYVLDARPRVVPSAAVAVDDIAARWFGAHAPATARSFAAALGIATGRAVSALKPLATTTLEVEGLGKGFIVPAETDFAACTADSPGAVDFLGLRDPLIDAHPNLVGLCSAAVAKSAVGRNQLPLPTVLYNGEVVAVWHWDGTSRTVVWRSLHPDLPPELAARIDERARAFSDFLAQEIHPAAVGAPGPRRHASPASELDVMQAP